MHIAKRKKFSKNTLFVCMYCMYCMTNIIIIKYVHLTYSFKFGSSNFVHSVSLDKGLLIVEKVRKRGKVREECFVSERVELLTPSVFLFLR